MLIHTCRQHQYTCFKDCWIFNKKKSAFFTNFSIYEFFLYSFTWGCYWIWQDFFHVIIYWMSANYGTFFSILWCLWSFLLIKDFICQDQMPWYSTSEWIASSPRIKMSQSQNVLTFKKEVRKKAINMIEFMYCQSI